MARFFAVLVALAVSLIVSGCGSAPKVKHQPVQFTKLDGLKITVLPGVDENKRPTLTCKFEGLQLKEFVGDDCVQQAENFRKKYDELRVAAESRLNERELSTLEELREDPVVMGLIKFVAGAVVVGVVADRLGADAKDVVAAGLIGGVFTGLIGASQASNRRDERLARERGMPSVVIVPSSSFSGGGYGGGYGGGGCYDRYGVPCALYDAKREGARGSYQYRGPNGY